jgi:multimeric flavodoxin WrbA
MKKGVDMSQQVVAIVGTYRKNGITEQIVDSVLKGARDKGADTEKIFLLEKHLEFCTNCRSCCSAPRTEKRGKCVLKDDLDSILEKIDSADGLVLASPINFYTVTAVMKRFVERLIVYSYWPWEKEHAPKDRVKQLTKKAVVITSSACPAIIGKFLMPNAAQILKISAKVVGAKVVKSVYFGMVAQKENQRLSEKQIKVAEAAGALLV